MLRRDFVKAGLLVPSLGFSGISLTRGKQCLLSDCYAIVTFDNERFELYSVGYTTNTYISRVNSQTIGPRFNVTNIATGETQTLRCCLPSLRLTVESDDNYHTLLNRIHTHTLNTYISLLDKLGKAYTNYRTTVILDVCVLRKTPIDNKTYVTFPANCDAEIVWNVVIERENELLTVSKLFFNRLKEIYV